MENEKKFGTEMFGYDKKEVEEYVKALKADYESKLQAERSDANRVANELSLVKRKLEKYETDYIAKQEKVASALITAEDQAKKIIENSRSEAIQEKDRIEHLIEMEKEDPISKDIMEKLSEVDVDDLSPREAWQMLLDLSAKAKEKK